jgi:EAL domain-containing protein (putative c-di-GMP-specific phosphodiesterase class I)
MRAGAPLQLINIVEDEAQHTRVSELAASLHNDIDCHWVTDLPSFDQMIDELAFDLVCYWIAEPLQAEMSTWVKLNEKQPRVRVILIDVNPSPDSYLLAGSIGAVDVVALANKPQLSLALHRELRIIGGDLKIAPMKICVDAMSNQGQGQSTQELAPVAVADPGRQLQARQEPKSASPPSTPAGKDDGPVDAVDKGKTNTTPAGKDARHTDSADKGNTNTTPASKGNGPTDAPDKGKSNNSDGGHPSRPTDAAQKGTVNATDTGNDTGPAGAAPKQKSDSPKPESPEAKVSPISVVKIQLDKPPEIALPTLVNDVNQALEHDNFELVYQPILAVHDHSVDNYEVFLRLRRDGKLMLPEEFFPEAAKYGLMTAIDCWVVNHAITRLNEEEDQRLAVAKKTRTVPRKVRMFINVSGFSLVDKGVLSKLVRTMIAADAGPERIVVDVDKHTVLTRLENAKTLNRNVKKLKLEFALNHYTEQDNSLNYLKHISIDYLKLQSELIDNLESDRRNQRGVKAIVERARENGIKTMACRVESMATMSYLYQVGIDYMQGYAIAEPGSMLEQEVFKDMQ